MTTDVQKIEIDLVLRRLGRTVADLETLAARDLPDHITEVMTALRDHAVKAHNGLATEAFEHGATDYTTQAKRSIASAFAEQTTTEIETILHGSELKPEVRRQILEQTLSIRRNRVVCDGAAPSPANSRACR